MELLTTSHGRALLVGPESITRDLQATLTDQGWTCEARPSPSGVLQRLRTDRKLDVVLLAPDATWDPCLELCRHIKYDARTAFVSVVFLTTADNDDHRGAIFASGADDCIQLPASSNELITRLSNACRIKRFADSLEDATDVICSLANAIEGRDSYTRGHVERVAAYAVQLGRRLNLGPTELAILRTGAIVHDIGKVAVPDQILNKPGRLTDEEMDIVRRHPAVGYDILQPLRTFRDVLPIVRWHHERPNGTGYPDALADKDLPLLPRIVAVADVFDALSTTRSYRPACPREKYLAILNESADRGDLDAHIVGLLLTMLEESAFLHSPAPIA